MQAKKNAKKEVLLISGLGNLVDLCPSAAIALRLHPHARIAFSSRTALPDVLSQNLPGDDGEVHLLGVGLTGDPAQLETVLDDCKRHGVRVVWHSAAFPFPASLPDSLRDLLEIDFDAEAACLVEVLARSCKDGADFLVSLAQGKAKGADAKAWYERIEAVGWNFGGTHDFVPLERLVRDLADCVPPVRWDGPTLRLLDAFARWGGRELEAVGPVMRQLRRDIVRVAKSDAHRVLVTGENGTGKETVAMLLHVQSGRPGPFLAFNCATVSRDLLESRLFGHAKGAFTGAGEKRPGLFREADGGTLFLDEIGELPLEMQGLLLRALQDGLVQGVGETDEVAVDVRVVAATNRDLAELVREGRFREDLYFRLSLVELHVPPLRERRDEFPVIVRNFWRKAMTNRRPLADDDLAALAAYDWPGNVRELHNVLERAALFPNRTVADLVAEEAKKCMSLRRGAGAGVPMVADPVADREARVPPGGDSELLADVIHAHILKVLERHGGNRSEAARALGISRGTLRANLKRLPDRPAGENTL